MEQGLSISDNRGVSQMGAFASPEIFEQYQRMAKALASSTIVPMAYRSINNKGLPNPEGVANCIVALDIAARLKTTPFLVMQNMDVIEGKPSWKSSYLISVVNTHPRFKGYLEFEFVSLGKKQVTTEVWKGEYPNAKKEPVITEVDNIGCTAWALDVSGKRLESMMVTCEMAILEGWWNRKGSKWPTMTKQMLTYRAASLFNRMYCPEVGLGMHTREEVEDFVAVENSELKVMPSANPSTTASEALNNIISEAEVVVPESPAPAPAPAPATKKATAPKEEAPKETVVKTDLGEVVNPGMPIPFTGPAAETSTPEPTLAPAPVLPAPKPVSDGGLL